MKKKFELHNFNFTNKKLFELALRAHERESSSASQASGGSRQQVVGG